MAERHFLYLIDFIGQQYYFYDIVELFMYKQMISFSYKSMNGYLQTCLKPFAKGLQYRSVNA